MCTIRKRQKRKDLCNLLVFHDLAFRKLYSWANLHDTMSQCISIHTGEITTYQVVEIDECDAKDKWSMGNIDKQRLRTCFP
jgi:hypothetical protein